MNSPTPSTWLANPDQSLQLETKMIGDLMASIWSDRGCEVDVGPTAWRWDICDTARDSGPLASGRAPDREAARAASEATLPALLTKEVARCEELAALYAQAADQMSVVARRPEERLEPGISPRAARR